VNGSIHALNSSAESTIPLTRGLARNTFFNLLGWAWPVTLSFIAVPYILSGLGTDAYGVFGIISVVAGYLGLLSGPMAMGNVRFMAEAFGRQDWDEFRRTVVAGIVIVGSLAALGAVAMFLSADLLVRSVFKIPAQLIPSAIVAFRLAAISFFLNGLTSAMNGIPAAMRRYDILNAISLSVGTLNTAGILFAIWVGSGLVGAVIAQVLSSALAVAAFGAHTWKVWRSLPCSGHTVEPDRTLIRRLVSFSALLFAGSLASTIGLRIDRTLVGILLGSSAVTYYVVPAKITDQIPGFIGRLTAALYPLSAEGLARGMSDELLRLYDRMVRISLFISGFLAAMLLVSARDVLYLWVGADIAGHSWLVLIFLAISVIWRGPGGVAYQVGNGLGRGDLYLGVSLLTLALCTLSVIGFSIRFGVVGAALGMLIGLALVNLIYDTLTRKRLLGQPGWVAIFLPYLKTIAAMGITGFCLKLWPHPVTWWGNLLVKLCIAAFLYSVASVSLGLLKTSELRLFLSKTRLSLRFSRHPDA